MSFRAFRRLILVILCLFAAPATAQVAAPTEPQRTLEAGEPQPAIWLLSDGDTRIWLFGTTHILPFDFAWRSPDLDSIIERVDELVLETSDEEVLAKPDLIARLMLREQPSSILARIGPEYRMPLQRLIKGSMITLDRLDEMRTWAVAFTLIGLSMVEIFGEEDFDGEYEMTGVEDQLTSIFDAAGKPVSGVETSIGQIGLLSSISEQGQREFLEALLEYSAEDEETQDEAVLHAPWVNGDVATLDGECADEENFPAELQEILLRRRNANWTEWLLARLDRPGDVLFAVGACHLAGPVSLQVMLAANGLTVERVH